MNSPSPRSVGYVHGEVLKRWRGALALGSHTGSGSNCLRCQSGAVLDAWSTVELDALALWSALLAPEYIPHSHPIIALI